MVNAPGETPDPIYVKEIAEKVLDLDDGEIPSFLLPILRDFLRDTPYDTAFTIELGGGNGFGTIICMEDFCWKEVMLDADPDRLKGGKEDGLGSLYNFQLHCDEDYHVRGRKLRCDKENISMVPSGPRDLLSQDQPRQPPAIYASLPAGRRSILDEMDDLSPPLLQKPSIKQEVYPKNPNFYNSVPAQAGPSRFPHLGVSSPSRLPSAPSTFDASAHPDVKPTLRPSSAHIAKGKQASDAISIPSDSDDDILPLPPSQIPQELRKVTNKDQPIVLPDEDDPSSAASRNADPARAWGALYSQPSRSIESRAPVPPIVKNEDPFFADSPSQSTLTATLPPAVPFTTPSTTHADFYVPPLQRMRLLRAEKNAVIAYYTKTIMQTPGPLAEVFLERVRDLNIMISGEGRSEYKRPSDLIMRLVPEVKGFLQMWGIGLRSQPAHVPPAPRDPLQGLKLSIERFNATAGPSNGPVFPTEFKPTIPGGYPDQPYAMPNLETQVVPYGYGSDPTLPGYDEEFGQEYDRPRTNQGLADFFSNSMTDFSEDQDVEGALKKLGLRTMTDKMKGLEITLMPHQVLGVSFMLEKERDKKFKGGMLLDAMGLGKTVQAIAVIAANRPGDRKIKQTLIIAPLALLSQWKNEIESKTTAGLFRVVIHHGGSRTKSANALRQADIVLTTYGTLTSECGKEAKKKKKQARDGTADSFVSEEEVVVRQRGPLYKIHWLRVVLDEAHLVRNKSTRAAKAVWELESVYRWSLTGTPIVNTLDDIYVHLRFLAISPCQEWTQFRDSISRSQKRRPKLATTRVQAILKTCSIRRNKESTLNGKRLLELPPKTTLIEELEFSPEERQIYNAVETRARVRFNKFLRRGEVMKHYSMVLVMLLRLRQLCCHPWLLRRNPNDVSHPEDLRISDDELFATVDEASEDDISEVARAITLLGQPFVDKVTATLAARSRSMVKAEHNHEREATAEGECPICFDQMTEERISACAHSFCNGCITEVFNAPPRDVDLTDEQLAAGVRKCPLCRGPLERNKIFRAQAFMPREPTPETEDDEGAGIEEISDDTDVKPAIANGELSAKAKGKRRASVGPDTKPDIKRFKRDPDGHIAGHAVEDGEGFDQLDEDVRADIENVLPSTKMKHMGDLVDGFLAEDPTHKCIIFSQFVSYIKLCSIFFRKRGIGYVQFVGAMKADEREDAIKTFSMSGENSPRIMLISLKCGGVGLNLTAASKVISLDLAWNAATENQAVDRAHRIGQTKPVDVRRLVIADSVEQRILQLQQQKEGLSMGALGEGGAGRLGRLSVQDLIKLFGTDTHE